MPAEQSSTAGPALPVQDITLSCPSCLCARLAPPEAAPACIMHACVPQPTKGLPKLVPAMHQFCMLLAVSKQSPTLVPSPQENGQGQGSRAQSGSRRVRTERQRSRQHLDIKFRSHFKQVGALVSVTAGACHRSVRASTHTNA